MPPADPAPPEAPDLVCVTGMHRCGTSIAMRAIRALGVSLGDEEQLQPAGADNPRGYWENRYLIELDDEVLAQLGGSWDRPPRLVPGWELDPALDGLRGRARRLLASAFAPSPDGAGRGGVDGMKDPRLSLLLPFWRTVRPVRATVVLVRDPREVAASLHARNGLDPTHSALLWLRYVFAALASDPTGALIVDAGGFFADLDRTLDTVAAHLGLPRPAPAMRAEVAAHIDPSLRHHLRGDAAGPEEPHDPVLAAALRVWNRGSVEPDSVAPELRAALAQGWLREPADGEALAAARAAAVDLTERLRRNRRARKAAEERVAELEAQLDAARAGAATPAFPTSGARP